MDKIEEEIRVLTVQLAHMKDVPEKKVLEERLENLLSIKQQTW